MPERLDRVRIDVLGELVEITWDERDLLLDAAEHGSGLQLGREQPFWAMAKPKSASTPSQTPCAAMT